MRDWGMLSHKWNICIPSYKARDHCRRQSGKIPLEVRDWGGLERNSIFWACWENHIVAVAVCIRFAQNQASQRFIIDRSIDFH